MLGRPGQFRVAMLLPPVSYGALPFSRDDAKRIAEIAVRKWFTDL